MAIVRLFDGDLDLSQRLVRRAGETAVLSEQDAGLLAYLVERTGRVVPREELATEVLGHRVRETSRAVDHAIRRLRVKIEADPAHPRHIESIRGVGYRFHPLRSHEEVLGRDEELVRLRAAMERPWVTVVGPGGVGKTTVARTLATEVGGRVVELAGERTVDDVVRRMAHVLEVDPRAPDLTAAVGEGLAALPDRLVVLDDVDHVAESLAPTVAQWAAGLPEGRGLLVTSRVRLGHPTERVLVLGPLESAAAQTLFDRRLPLGCDVDGDAAQPLVQLCDGLPLAIELAASWMDLVSPTQLAERVTELTARDGRTARHASLEAMLDGSWELLSEVERVTVARAVVFAGAFDLDGAEQVLAVPDGPPVLHLLARLYDKSLLVLDGATSRYRLLAPVRAFLRQRHPPDQELVLAHAAYVLREATAGWERLSAVVDDLLIAFEATLPLDPVLACKLVGALNPYAWRFSPAEVALDRIQRAIEAVGDRDAVQATRMRWGRGMWLSRLGSLDDATEALWDALRMADKTDEPSLVLGVTNSLFVYLWVDGRLDEAGALHDERYVHPPPTSAHGSHRARVWMHRAMICSHRGDRDGATAAFGEAVTCARDADLPGGVADVLRFQAEHESRYGDLAAAEARYLEALHADAAGSYGAQLSHLALARVRHVRGRLEAAQTCLDDLQRLGPLGADIQAPATLLQALLRWEAGALDEADALLAEAEQAYERSGRGSDVAACAAARGALAGARLGLEAGRDQWRALEEAGRLDALRAELRDGWGAHLWGGDPPELRPGLRGASCGVRQAWRLLGVVRTSGRGR